jgi:spore germination cell wall hydrolase CwlJ-like protein
MAGCESGNASSLFIVTASPKIQSLSTIVIEGQVMLVGMEGVTHYHTTSVQPPWAKQFAARRRIGSHIFYGPK